jgi:hypothetical protein
MRIHGNQSNLNQVNPYAAASERAIAAQRAATTRKKLLKSAINAEGPCSPTEAFNLCNWVVGPSMLTDGIGENRKF